MIAHVDQASAVPFRRRAGQVEFCVITSIRRGRWGFPKGIIDPGETYLETALKEAHEEAGLLGRIVGPPLGTYGHRKWGQRLAVVAVLMEVTAAQDRWEEDRVRKRAWLNAERARERLDRPTLQRLLETALKRLG